MGLATDNNRFALAVLDLIEPSDPLFTSDQERLSAMRARRRTEPAAEDWGLIRRLHVDQTEVNRHLLTLVPHGYYRAYIDIGTGTSKVLTALAPRVHQAIGIGNSREMLAVACDRTGS